MGNFGHVTKQADTKRLHKFGFNFEKPPTMTVEGKKALVGILSNPTTPDSATGLAGTMAEVIKLKKDLEKLIAETA